MKLTPKQLALVEQAVDLGLTRKQAVALARQYFNMPRDLAK